MKNNIISALISLAGITLFLGVFELTKQKAIVEQVDCVSSFTIDSANAFESVGEFFLLQAAEVATPDPGNSLCIIRAIDFDAGSLIEGVDTVRFRGFITYPQVNTCQAIGDTVVNGVDTRFVICENLLTLCEEEMGELEAVVFELDSDNQIVDQCRVALTFPEVNVDSMMMMMDTMMMDTMMMDTMMMDTMMMDTMMMDTMMMDTMMMDTMMMDTMMMDTMLMDTMTTGPITFGNGLMPCSLGGNTVSFRVTFQDDIQTSGQELPLMSDTEVSVLIGGEPEVISIADIWDLDFSHQSVRFLWNPVGVDARTIRAGQFYRLYFDFGTDINEITDAARDVTLEGNPTVTLLGDNVVVVQWGPGTSIGSIFDATINLSLDQCQVIEEMEMDTMVVIAPSDQIDTSVDCDDFAALSFELAELSDSTFNVTDTFIASGTDPILSFAFDGVEFTTDSVLVIDSTFLMDTIITVDSIAIIDTSELITTSIVIDSTLTGTEQVAIFDSIFMNDTMFVLDTLGFIVDTMITIDSSEVVNQIVVSVDTLMFTDTTFTIDTMFVSDTLTVLDTTFTTSEMTVVDTLGEMIDTTFTIDTTLVNGMEVIDTTFTFDTLLTLDSMLVVDTLDFMVDTMTTINQIVGTIDTSFTTMDVTQLDTMFMLDTMIVEQEILTLDSMLSIDTTMINITQVVTLDTSFVFQNVFEFDTTFIMDTMTVIGQVFVPDSVLVIQNTLTRTDTSLVVNTRTVIDSLFDIDTMTIIDTMLVNDSILVLDTMLAFDTTFVEENILTFDTIRIIFDTIFDADSMIVRLDTIAFAIDTMEMVGTVPVIDSSQTIDSMFVTRITPVIDTMDVFDFTFLGLDTMVITDSMLVIDSTFTQDTVLRERQNVMINTTLEIDSTFAIVNDFNVMNGDTICGNLRLGPVEGLNSLNYALSWNPDEYELVSCRNGELPLFNCENSNTDIQTGTIQNGADSISVTIIANTILAEYCVVVLDETIDSPQPFMLEQAYNNARTITESELVSVNSGLSLGSFGLSESETLSNDGISSFIVNRCLVLGTNFDNGVAVLDGPGLAFQYSAGCTPDGMTSQSIPFELCDSRIETCCDNLGTEDVVLISFTSEGIINTCRFPLTVSDVQRTCNPIATFECLAEQTVSTDDIQDNGDGTFSISLDAFGLGGSEDHCIIKTVDYDEGPIRLSTGNLVIIDGDIAYPATGCTTDDTFIEEIRDQNGNLIEQVTIEYVLCDDAAEFCCEDFDGLELTIVTQPFDGTVITDVCQTTIRIEDADLSIDCQPIQITCIDDLNDSELLPDVLSSGICSISTELSFIDDLSSLDTCGIGIVTRTLFVDENGDGELSETDASCVQQITIVPSENFDPVSIRWPVSRTSIDVTSGVVLTCSDAMTTSSTVSDNIQLGGPLFCSTGDEFGEVTWCEAGCQLIGYTTETATSPGDSDGCAEVVITHTVIDWCTYTSLGRPDDNIEDLDMGNFEAVQDERDGCEDCGEDGPATYLRYREDALNVDGIYTYLQTIIIEDDQDPVINAPETFVVSTSRVTDGFGNVTNCEGRDSLRMSATDFCGTTELSGELTWNVRIRNFVALPVPDEDGLSSYTFTGNEFAISTRTGEQGERFFVTIDVRDACGNRATQTTVIDFDDIDPPIASCVEQSPLIQLEEDSVTTINASTFDDGSTDNCSIQSALRFSVVRPGVEPINPRNVNFGTQRSIDVACNDFQGISTLDVWVWDLNFNGSRCSVNLNFDSSNCGEIEIDTSASMIAGNVRTPLNAPLGDVVVSLNSNSAAGNFPKVVRTDDNGQYTFVNNQRGQDYQLSVTFDGDIGLGLSTIDLVLIQQHILGLNPFDNPFQIIASDADASGSVSVSDVITFRNVIIGTMPRFPNNNSWVVIPEEQEFFDSLSPFPFMTEIDILGLDSSLVDQNFVAIKIGDVNYSADPSTLSSTVIRSDERKLITIADREINRGEIVEVDINLNGIQELKGFQFALEHADLELVDLQSEHSIDNKNYNTQNELTKFSWNEHSFVDAELSFTLTFKARSNGRLSELLKFNESTMDAEAYGETAIVLYPLGIEFTETSRSLLVFQNEPNPFTTQTSIEVTVSEDSDARLSVFDVTGTRVYEKEFALRQGSNQLTLNAEDFNAHGVLYYQVEANGISTVQKMIILK